MELLVQMDQNKLKVLHEIGYTIKPSCLTCIHGQFKPMTPWGTCGAKQYAHLKHADSRRQLSIHILGVCKDGFEPDLNKISNLDKFQEFFKS